MAKTDQTKPTFVSIVVISMLFAFIYMVTHIRQELSFLYVNGITGYIDASGYHPHDIRYIRNLLNIAYCLQGIAMLVFPASMLSFPKNRPAKNQFIKLTCYFIAITYFMGNMWIVKWLFQGIFRNMGFSPDFKAYQDTNCYIFNHMSWGSNSSFGIILNLLCGTAWALIGYHINRKYKSVYKYVIMALVCSFVLPILINLCRYLASLMFPDTVLTGDELLTKLGISIINGERHFWWLNKSAFLFMSQLALVILFRYVSKNHERYEQFVCTLPSYHIHRHHGAHRYSSNSQNYYYESEHGSHNHGGSDKKVINWTPVSGYNADGEGLERSGAKAEIDDNMKIGNIISRQSKNASSDGDTGLKPASHALNNKAASAEKEFHASAEVVPASHMQNKKHSDTQKEFHGSAEIAPARAENKSDETEQGDIVWISRK